MEKLLEQAQELNKELTLTLSEAKKAVAEANRTAAELVMVPGARLVKKKSSAAPAGQRLSDVGRRCTPLTAPSAHPR